MPTEKIIREHEGELGLVTIAERAKEKSLTFYIVRHSAKPHLTEQYIALSEAEQYALFLTCKY